MGITSFDIELLDKIIKEHNPKKVGELGSQNLYLNSKPLPAPFANIFYESKGIEYTCFDVSKENNCLHYDLTYPLPKEFSERYDLVTDFGCTEHYGRDGQRHVEGFYNSWVNKHSILKTGGVMISENPKSHNWPLHGFNYYVKEFYIELAKLTDYKILELDEVAAMGNFETGMNVYCIMKKTSEKFPTLEQFKLLPLKME